MMRSALQQVFIVCACLLSISQSLVSGSDEEYLSVIAESYAHNRESFPVLDCVFEVESGLANTYEDALNGHWEVDRRSIGEWVVSGETVRYSFTCDRKDTSANNKTIKEFVESGEVLQGKKNIELPSNCDSRTFLRTEELTLSYGPLFTVGNLFRKPKRGTGIRLTPFNFDVLATDEIHNPGYWIRESFTGRTQCKLLENRKINGIDLDIVSAEFEGRAGPTFGFDPDRGFLPFYFEMKDPDSRIVWCEVYIQEAKKCSEGRWFPTELVKIYSPKRSDPESNGPFRVERMIVKSLVLDKIPAPERFQLELPVGARLFAEKGWLTLKSAEITTPADLASLETRMIEVERKHQDLLQGNVPKKVLANGNLKYWIILANVIALLVIVFLFFRSRKRSQAASS